MSEKQLYTAYVTPHPDNEGTSQLDLKIEGAHCAACIQKIESTLHRQLEINYARLNFSTKRLHIEWNGLPDLAEKFATLIQNLGYKIYVYDDTQIDDASSAENKDLMLKLGVAGFASGNLMLLSFGLWMTDQNIMGMATRDFMHLISGLIALPAIIYAGQPFYKSAFTALRHGGTNMDVPISIALLLASSISLFETFRHGEHVFFDSAVMLMFFLLIGRYLDSKARRKARENATDLLSMLAGTATIIKDNQQKYIPIRDLREDMEILIAAGEKIPADAHITKGHSTLDSSLITGETIPQNIQPGDQIYAGTLNIDAPLTATVSKAASNSLLADIVRLMESAQQSQAKYVKIADRAAGLYTPIVHTLSACAFLGWWLIGGIAWQSALMIAVTVLIITCPCALGLAVPVVQVLATGKLMKDGILVKSGDALERLAQIDTIFFDKTGTLTLANATLQNPDQYDTQTLQIAASIASHSAHPLSKSLVKSWQKDFLDLEVIEQSGLGLSSGKYKLGSRSWCGDKNHKTRPDCLELWLKEDGKPPIPFYFSDQLRPDAKRVISKLKRDGLHLTLISGDRDEAAQSIGQTLNITDIYSQQKPTDKYDILMQEKDKGRNILMVGDGLNDAPVLAGANVSMSPSTAIDMAQNAADIIFNGDHLQPVHTLYHTARFSQKLIEQNFAIAIIYNILAVPLALMGMVTPMIAAIAMSASSLIVIANSFRLNTQQPKE